MDRPAASNVTLRLTTVHAAAGVTRYWCVLGPADTVWSQVADGVKAPDPAYVGSVRVEATTRLGIPPLINDVVISDVASPESRPHLLQVVAVEGPCVGARAALTSDPLSVGRALDNHLVLGDEELSRRHCELRIEQGRAVVRDAGSTNGTRIDDRPISTSFTDVRVGQRLRVGGTTLALERTVRLREGPKADASGRYPIHRPPRQPLQLSDVELTEPRPPDGCVRRGFPWVSATVPLLLAGAMVLLLHNPLFAMFALLSPVMVLAQYVGDRGTSRGRRHIESTAHGAAIARFEQDCAAALRWEVALRRRIAPPVTQAADDVSSRAAAVWHRAAGHDDHLSFRIGTGEGHSRVWAVSGTGSRRALPVIDVPMTISLQDHRVVGLSGDLRHPLARSALIQLAAWQSPNDLRMVVLCAEPSLRRRWSSVRALPHLRPHPGGAARVALADPDDPAFVELCSRLATPSESSSAQVLVVLDGRVTGIPAVADLLTHAAPYGLAMLALDEDHGRLPTVCATTIRIDGPGRGWVGEVPFRPDLPVPELVHRIARELAALVDAGPADLAQQVPDRVDHLELVLQETGVDGSDAQAVLQWWSMSKSSTRALLGRSPDGPLWVDLAVDGPPCVGGGHHRSR